jgi:glycosyltransferase involved in cell wall biosynthesis
MQLARSRQSANGLADMNSPAPAFSLVMASFNNGHLLPNAIHSVLKQVDPDWELIIVDDSSSDGSLAIARQFASQDHRVRVFVNEHNGGVGFTKRRGVAESRGTIVGILDPDDALTPNAITTMIKAHRQHPDASLCWSEHLTCDDTLIPSEASNSEFRGDAEMGYLTATPGDIHHFWAFKRDAYDRTAGFDSKLRFAEDQDLFYKLEEVGHTKHVPEVLYYYRHHSGAISLGRKTASAFAVHLEVMFAALTRRHVLKSSLWNSHRDVVFRHYLRFCDWGMPLIGRTAAFRLVWAALHLFGVQALSAAVRKTLPVRVIKKIRSLA